MKRLLLISVSAGAGHKRAAQALEKQAQQDYPDIAVQHIDMATLVSFPTRAAFFDSYELLVRQLPELWGIMYRASDHTRVKKLFDSAQKMLGSVDTKRFLDTVKAFHPDHIICTHFVPANILAHTTDSTISSIPRSIVVTDYGMHELWVSDNPAHYFVATESIKQKLIGRSIHPDDVVVSGIPVDPIFYAKKNTTAIKEKMGVSADKPIILVLAGGQGLIATDGIVKELFSLATPHSIIAIAGKQKALEQRLAALLPPKHHELHVLGWTDHIDEYMRIADIVVTKPGGITTSECIALGKPIVAISAIPGQEEANATYIAEHNLGTICNNLSAITSCIASCQTKKPKEKRIAAQTILSTILSSNT